MNHRSRQMCLGDFCVVWCRGVGGSHWWYREANVFFLRLLPCAWKNYTILSKMNIYYREWDVMNGGLTCFGVPVGNETGGLLWMVCYIIAGLGKYVSVGVFPEFPISSPALLCVQQIVRLKTLGPTNSSVHYCSSCTNSQRMCVIWSEWSPVTAP